MMLNSTYDVKFGTLLRFWENNGWIYRIDPYSWFHWYFRYVNGRFDYYSISPKLRKILLHWCSELVENDL